MKIINTLGPKQTDSYQAAQYLAERQEVDIRLHASFDDIYNGLAELKGQYLLVPVAFRSAQSDANWVDNNYKYVDQLSIVDTFFLPTMPMILVHNPKQDNQKVVLHPATSAFLHDFESDLVPDYVSSKPEALKKFLHGDYAYAIVSEEWFESAMKQGFSGSQFEVIKRFTPTMIWCLYKIIGK
ncbi:hypothetical protein AKUH4B101A_01380 [Apilactobacillus kunkeei]|uniref:hypothetical protein n=1 Tax=Apilactobacillus waqarii TaxID=2851006 RepID=UPI0021FBCDEB|nr:hypothetical protein AKUH4B403J_01380 [Apilactobacillus kunkeei]CAI2556398.1 hypothetical protein AKUH4B103J_01380 [Apilactobacillus kunkeei]CAI2556824.1 hypothetical protein AKUH4B303J_01380 [Apilactobacillus kunkeei]CAI2556913.1 hypothetical protein AKUH4B116J_01380 [Apilactobacillus kunkeei]CAI2556949.1 hypothetical protein AKUH4B203M_01380 [Apilactobacillus kunkeei]